MLNYNIIIFATLTIVIFLFQIGLVIGMPWGKASMGGRFPGKQPVQMRVVAFFNSLLILGFLLIALIKSNILLNDFYNYSAVGIWIIVGFYGLGTILNSITTSKIERIWAPICLIQFIISILIAME